MKLSHHNGRAGKNGSYNPKHNDRQFNIGNSEHIDDKKAARNIYWDCYQGFRTSDISSISSDHNNSAEAETFCGFEDIEKLYYYEHYGPSVKAQNERNIKSRHPERNRTPADLLTNKKTCPEESILQIGDMEAYADPDVLFQIANEFFEEMTALYGEHFHIIDWALHLDEATPHIHERHVFDCDDGHGHIKPQQEKALELMGIELPDPSQPCSRLNNRKITFDKICREKLLEKCKKYKLEVDHEPTYGGRKYMEKNELILANQKTKITDRIKMLEDIDSFAKDIASTAYSKACEAVTKTVTDSVRNEDIKCVSDYKNWYVNKSPNPDKSKALIGKVLSHLEDKLKGLSSRILQKAAATLKDPAIKQVHVEEITQTTKVSIHSRMAEYQALVDGYSHDPSATKSKSHDRDLS